VAACGRADSAGPGPADGPARRAPGLRTGRLGGSRACGRAGSTQHAGQAAPAEEVARRLELMTAAYDGPTAPELLAAVPVRVQVAVDGIGRRLVRDCVEHCPPSMGGMDQRLLLVHAHPDDETIGQGATMASYAARGTQVTLVTCTLGEEGEVLVPELAHLAAEHDDTLGEHRVIELANAMKELGVTDHRFLGGAGHYRDSGMMWDDQRRATARTDTRDGTFWRADLLEASDLLVDIIREVRPQVLVTYDQYGNYGHPDHIQAHRVATYAMSLAAVPSYLPDLGPPWDVAKVYWGAMSLSRMREGLRAMRAAGDTTTFEGMDPDGEMPPFMVPDDQLSAVVEADDFADAKIRAMQAHATQIAVDGPFFALSNNIGNHVWGTEFYRIAKGVQGPVNEDGLETDLFAGLE
jgi:N-acetyl-1-D-myo-inositol-2-amino-2-deoxy-alpha-D-glucopyranoside deacetylase